MRAAPPKKHSRKRRKRPLTGAEEESESSGTETGGFRRTSVDGEGLDAGDAETVASSIIALRSELQEAQAMINSLFKRQHYIKQPIVHPGGGPKPLEAGKPWCEKASVFAHYSPICLRLFYAKHFAATTKDSRSFTVALYFLHVHAHTKAANEALFLFCHCVR